MEKIIVGKAAIQPIKKQELVSSTTMYRVLFVLPIAMILVGLFTTPPRELLRGLYEIVKINDVLLVDYLVVGGVGATLVNAGVIALVNAYLLRALKLRPNGIIVSAIFLLLGFGFMGKNFINIWPFYIGGLLYSRYHQIDYKNVVIINMLSTTLSPLTGVLVENIKAPWIISLLISFGISVFVGFIMPTISSHVMTAHAGYSIYNMGFAGGLVAIILYSIMDAIGFSVTRNTGLSGRTHYALMIFILVVCFFWIAMGYWLNGKSFKGLKNIFTLSGRVVTDMIHHVDFGLTLVNMGLLGIIGVAYVLLMGGNFNGPTIAAIFTMIGFGAFGKHLKNTIPILAGVAFAGWILPVQVTATTVIITGLFGTTLAPIAGEFGPLIGLLVGFVHFTLTLNISNLHGGLHLYNNGLSGGIIATLFIPLLNAFRREKP